MNRLFKLKKWLTLPESARYLALAFGEEVNESDVLRLALDGHLTLSVNFVNHAEAVRGNVVPLAKAKTVPGICREGEEPYEVVLALRLNDDDFLELEEKVTTLDGVWDLPLIGNETLDVEHQYQQLTDGPAVTLQGLDGAFVKGLDGQLFQLQESYDENEYQVGSDAHLRKLKERIALESIEPSKAKELLDQQQAERKKYLARKRANRDAGNDAQNYYPAGGLPDDSVLVVRTEALREFEASISEGPAQVEKPLTTNERNTLLTIIAALCDYSAIKHQERGAATQIAKLTEDIGATVTDDTIRKTLTKIPDALATRMK